MAKALDRVLEQYKIIKAAIRNEHNMSDQIERERENTPEISHTMQNKSHKNALGLGVGTGVGSNVGTAVGIGVGGRAFWKTKEMQTRKRHECWLRV